MNTYRYCLPVIGEEDTWYMTLFIRMTNSHRKIFNYCLRNNQREELSSLYEYLASRNLQLGCGNMEPFGNEHCEHDEDLIYEYSGRKKVYKFDAIMPDDVEDRISVYIQMPEILFDQFNDNANLGDIPQDLSDIIDLRVKELELENRLDDIYMLECDNEVDDSIIDYKWCC